MTFAFDGIHLLVGETSFTIYYYGIILMAGTLAGGLVSYSMAKQMGEDAEKMWDLLIWLVVGGIIGARLWHVFTPSPSLIASGITTEYYFTHPLDLINLRRGGLGIPGAVIGGVISLALFTRKHGLQFSRWLDISAFGLAIGQAIGRWGNYFNQELYGKPTDLPWKIFIDPAHRLAQYANQAYYHPLFLYESLWNLFNLGLLVLIFNRWSKKTLPGDIFLCYLVIYPFGRFMLDFIRVDASELNGINANQTIMGFVLLASLVVLAWRRFAKPLQQ